MSLPQYQFVSNDVISFPKKNTWGYLKFHFFRSFFHGSFARSTVRQGAVANVSSGTGLGRGQLDHLHTVHGCAHFAEMHHLAERSSTASCVPMVFFNQKYDEKKEKHDIQQDVKPYDILYDIILNDTMFCLVLEVTPLPLFCFCWLLDGASIRKRTVEPLGYRVASTHDVYTISIK